MHRALRQAPVDRLIDRSIDVITEDAIRRNTFQGAQPRTLCERARDGEFDKDSDDSQYGDALFNRIVECMSEFGEGSNKIELRVDQRVMFSHCMGALLPLIYGDKLEANRKRLLSSLGLDKISQEVIILASRRVGKTYFVAMQLAALLICVPEIEIVIFSKSLRQSAKAAQLVVKFVKMHPLGKSMFVRSNQELVELQGDAPWKTKKLHSFPDRVDVCTLCFFFLLFFFFGGPFFFLFFSFFEQKMSGERYEPTSYAHKLFCRLEDGRCHPSLVMEDDECLSISLSKKHQTEKCPGLIAIILSEIPIARFSEVRLSFHSTAHENTDEFRYKYTKMLMSHLRALSHYQTNSILCVSADFRRFSVQITDWESKQTKTIYVCKET